MNAPRHEDERWPGAEWARRTQEVFVDPEVRRVAPMLDAAM
ncbi:MAG TPA: hypothetical protein VHN14_26765 [Kofleriaceae bacterium]|jgi:hypothetical protein|nr:hypothetical protein [Kofleriaceae bacterium]